MHDQYLKAKEQENYYYIITISIFIWKYQGSKIFDLGMVLAILIFNFFFVFPSTIDSILNGLYILITKECCLFRLTEVIILRMHLYHLISQ